MTDSRRVVLIVSLMATSGLAIALGVTDPTAPVFYPTRFLVWNLVLAWIPVFFAMGSAVVPATDLDGLVRPARRRSRAAEVW